MKKKLHRLLVFFLLCQLNAAAQTEGYKYEAAIKPVDSSGFYNFTVGPVLNAHLKIDFSDLRLVNDSGIWMPHLVREPNVEISKGKVVSEKRIVEKTGTNKSTTLIIENTDKTISNLILTIGNTTERRFCFIAGSNTDGVWYQISDSVEIVLSQSDEAYSKAVLSFPSVSYQYIMIQIYNDGKKSLNIIKAASEKPRMLSDKFEYNEPIENPDTKLLQIDSNKVSYIRIEQKENFHFDNISLLIKHQGYFKRRAELYIPSIPNHSFSKPGLLSGEFVVSNNSTRKYDLPHTNAKVFYILIYNDDNPPLIAANVKTFCNYRVATVYLEKGKTYRLLMANESAVSPQYDLSLEDIPYHSNTPHVEIEKIVPRKIPAEVAENKKGSSSFIWGVIAIAAAVLAFFTYRLITDMNKSKT